MGMEYTVVSPMKQPERISRSLGVFAGKVTIDSYNSTIVECTGITRYFKRTSNATTGGFAHGICSVQLHGPSSSGYIANWDYASGGFKCYSPVGGGVTVDTALAGAVVQWDSGAALHATSKVGTLLGAVGKELDNNTDVGEVGFVAVGLI